MSGTNSSPTMHEVLSELSHISRRLACIEKTVVPLARIVTKRESTAEQARRAGVSRTTIWRRAKREQMRLRADGTFK